MPHTYARHLNWHKDVGDACCRRAVTAALRVGARCAFFTDNEQGLLGMGRLARAGVAILLIPAVLGPAEARLAHRESVAVDARAGGNARDWFDGRPRRKLAARLPGKGRNWPSLRPSLTALTGAMAASPTISPLCTLARRSGWEISVNQDENVTLVLW